MRILVIMQLIMLPVMGFGQDWSPIGAEWYYDITYAFSGNIDYHRIYCDSVISINGTDCKRIDIDYCACNNYFCDQLYTFAQNDTIFFYNPDVNSFQILYDFSAVLGDEWIINTKDDDILQEIVVHIDSVSVMDINSFNLPVFYVTYSYFYDVGFGLEDGNTYNSTIIKNIGDLNFLINVISPWVGACDVDYLSNLRCYQDSQLGFYSNGYRDSCDYRYVWTSLREDQNASLKLYPNPVTDVLNIENDFSTNRSFYLYDVNGRLVIRGNSTKIDLSYLQSGLYFLNIINNNSSETYRIIKH